MKRALFFLIIGILVSCTADEKANNSGALFQKMSAEKTGVDFINEVEDQENFNILSYRNYYNGGGVAVGDINNDSLPDLFFTANMKANQLYLNKGNWQFENISVQAGIEGNKPWSTGVTMADVNGDGWLDIYVANSGDVSGANKKNELFINNKDNSFTEAAEEWGLANEGFGTHASFFDYDLDGDLDCYILNNSFKDPSKIDFKNVRDQRNDLEGDKLLQNNGSTFIDVSEQAGIYGSNTGFGLGVSVSDINQDQLPDIYISNDFWERDYLYINKGDGSFSEELTRKISMTSTSSMGADIADINNDGFVDIFSTDMLPTNHERLKKTTVFNDYKLEDLKYRADYHFQYTQNCLQINQQDGSFQEAAHFKGVAATDWSWAALLFDFDNNGTKDIYVSNGVYHDITDLDFSDFLEDQEAIKAVVEKKGRYDFRDFLDFLPSNKISNYAFVLQENGKYLNKAKNLGLGEASFSNGSAYADLDNDGDLDLVVNNVNMPCFIYQNYANQSTDNNYLKLGFKGEGKNPFGIGASVEIHTSEGAIISAQNYQSRGFQSATEPILTLGIGNASINKLIVNWPGRKQQEIVNPQINSFIELYEVDAAIPQVNSTKQNTWFQEITNSGLSKVKHQENLYNDFDHERLLMRMISTEGPEMVKGDLNGDGLEDFILLAAADQSNQVLLQTQNGKFKPKRQASFANDAKYESTCAVLVDLDGDKDLDVIIGSGGNEYQKGIDNFKTFAYLNDGQGNFSKSAKYAPNASGNLSTLQIINSGSSTTKMLFAGGRVIPGNYGLSPRSFLFIQDENGWKDITTKETGPLGLVTDALTVDLDDDGDDDLIIVGEWMPITILMNDKGSFTKLEVPNSSGLWQCISAADIDKNGTKDLILGNWGLNTKFQADQARPMTMYLADYDGNKKLDCIVNWYPPEDNKSYPFASKRDLTSQLPFLKKTILKNGDYAKMQYEDIFEELPANKLQMKSINYLSSAVLYNKGQGSFELTALPNEAQMTPIFSILAEDLNNDDQLDILMGGNFYGLKPEVGRIDGSKTVLFNVEENQIKYIPNHLSGIRVDGEIRNIQSLNSKGGGKQIVVARNNNTIKVFEKHFD